MGGFTHGIPGGRFVDAVAVNPDSDLALLQPFRWEGQVDRNEVRTHPTRYQLLLHLLPERIITDSADQKHFTGGRVRTASKYLCQDSTRVGGSTTKLRTLKEKIPQQFSDRRDAQGFRAWCYFRPVPKAYGFAVKTTNCWAPTVTSQ